MSTRELLKSPGVPVVLLLYGYVMLLGFAYTAGSSRSTILPHQSNQLISATSLLVAPVFYFTDIALGGYGFSPLQISLFMALGGLAQSIWLLIAFPPLQRRFGTGGVLRGCAVVWPILYFTVAAGNLFLRQAWDLVFWIVAPTSLVIGSGVAMAFSESSVPRPQGTL